MTSSGSSPDSALRSARSMTLVVVPSVLPEHANRMLAVLESVCGRADLRVHAVLVANSDAVSDFAERPRVDVLRPGTNLGYGQSVNVAARLYPHWERMLVLNDDIVFEDESVLIDLLSRRSSSDIAVFVGRGDEGPRRRLSGSWLSFSRISLLSGLGRRLRSESPEFGLARRGVLGVPETVGLAAFSVNRRAWEELSGFDDRILHYFEDVDLLDRAHASQQRVSVESVPGFRHVRNASNRARRSSVFPVEVGSAITFCTLNGMSRSRARVFIGLALVIRFSLRMATRQLGLGVAEMRSGVGVLTGRSRPVLPYRGWGADRRSKP